MIVGIFIPIYFRENLVKKCLESLLKSDFGGIDVFLCLGINGATSEFKEYLKRYVTYVNGRIFKHVHVFDDNKNLGKPKMVNLMAEKYNTFDYLVSMDSDIVTIDDKWLKKFLYAFDLYRGDYQLSGICAAQEGNDCNFVQTLKDCQTYEINKEMHLMYNTKCEGVAGAVLITKREIWNMFEGYGAKNIYGDDDSSYAQKSHYFRKLLPMFCEVKVYHPSENNIEYSKWKLKAAHGKLEEKESSGFFENLRK